ncbi:MAG: TetR family transcriptional regulator [Solirubrobacteraceae bacterium]
MSDAPHQVEEEPLADEHVDQIIVSEVGEEIGALFNRTRRAQEALEQERRPHEGLRERKRRLTRQRISDVATVLFSTRGFDNVTVAEVADIVGVSEKTIYNYFPTKESLVLDQADDAIETFARILRDRRPDESLTAVALRALREDDIRFDAVPDELVEFFPRFAEMVDSTPTLRAAWLDMRNQLIAVAVEEIAARAELDPNDPEPQIAARALLGLGDISFESRVRYIKQGLRGRELNEAVKGDVERAARLIETGLWSFNLLTHGRRTRQQMLDAAATAEEARKQVLKALRQARAAWRSLRDQK